MDSQLHTSASAPQRRLNVSLVLSTLSIAVVSVFLCVHFWFIAQTQLFDQMQLHLTPVRANLQQFHQQQRDRLDSISPLLAQLESEQLGGGLERATHRSAATFEHLAIYRDNGQRLAWSSISGEPGQPPSNLRVRDRQYLKQHQATVFGGSYNINGTPHMTLCRPQSWLRNSGFLCLFSSRASSLADAVSNSLAHHLELELVRADGVLLFTSLEGKQSQDRLGETVSISLKQALDTSLHGEALKLSPTNSQINSGYYYLMQFLPSMDVALLLETPLHRASAPFLRFVTPLLAGVLIIVAILVGLYRLQLKWVSQQQQSDQQLRQQNSTLREESALLSRTLQGCIYRATLPELTLTHITHDQHSILGRELQQRLERHNTLLSLINEQDQEGYLHQIEQHKNSQQPYEAVYRLNSSEQELRWILDRGNVHMREDNQYEVEGFLVDITDQTLSQQHINYLATRDPLTELGNRYWFNDELISYTRHQANRQRMMALLFIDLDRFKTINDSLGHQFGDHLLKEVAQRLRQQVPDHYPLARLGGDEFMIMMTDGRHRTDIEHMARRIITSLSDTYRIEQFKLNTSCSIGISLFPQDSNDAFVLMRNADTAMYQAKNQGGNTFQFYTDEMNQRVNSRLTLENELRRAIHAQEFELYYQPQICTRTNRLLGAEALIRWQHPDAGMISPADFIPVAEDTGLITEIGDWALREACTTFQQWNLYRSTPLPVSVNVSVRQLSDDFVTRVKEIIEQSGIAPKLLELEITESLLMDNVKQNIEWLDRIHELGIHFAMDDFGTGYSSLSYLKQFPISKLKIDRAFIMDITSDADDEAIVRAILAMSHTLRLKVVAEGVETEEQLSMLQQMNCDSYQGYYFSKPVDKATFEQRFLEPIPQLNQS